MTQFRIAPAALGIADKMGPPREDTARAQELLARLGLCDDPPDGMNTLGTRAALRAFQEKHGLPRTGVADARTLKALEDNAQLLDDPTLQRALAQPSAVRILGNGNVRVGNLTIHVDAHGHAIAREDGIRGTLVLTRDQCTALAAALRQLPGAFSPEGKAQKKQAEALASRLG
jgi:peptidoglycan hydrolase-like protein with peptidoglycan-binding domain